MGTKLPLASTTKDGLIDNSTQTVSGIKTWTGLQIWQTPSPGLIPLGSVIATFPNLTGAYATAATTAADLSGFVLCQGQTIADVTSPMNGVVIPNINNSVFLRGNTTSGASVANTATKTLSALNIPTLSSNYTPLGTVDTSHTHPATSLIGALADANVDHTHAFDTSYNGGHSHSIDQTNLSHTHTFSTGNMSANSVHKHDIEYSAIGGNSLFPGQFAQGPNFYRVPNTNVATHDFSITDASIQHTHSGATDGASITMNHSHTMVSVADHRHGGTTLTGAASGFPVLVAHNHGLGSLQTPILAAGGVTNLVGTPALATYTNASPTAITIEPTYISAVYLMRVK